MCKILTDELIDIYEKEKSNSCLDVFSILVESLAKLSMVKWLKCSESTYHIGKLNYIANSKKANEKITEEFFDNLITTCKISNYNHDNSYIGTKFKSYMLNFCKQTGFFNYPISPNYPYDFIRSTTLFINKAREFDCTIRSNEISQALRNVWTMNLLQTVFSLKLEITPSVFSYSLLYPYTDNLLDKKSISYEHKIKFCSSIKNRLMGKFVLSSSEHEAKVFNLIENIELEFPRCNNNALYKSLHSINLHQAKSIDNQRNIYNQNNKQILLNTIKKGGTSVLSDGFLLKSNISLQDIIFSFSFGVLLQLLDDFQDIKIDKTNSHKTIFSHPEQCTNLDKLACKLINYIDEVLSILDYYNSPYISNIKKTIKENCLLTIFFTVARNKKLFTKEFNNNLEKYYPFTTIYMKNFNKKISYKYKKVSKVSHANLIDILELLS